MLTRAEGFLSDAHVFVTAFMFQTFAGDVGHLWKTSESLLVYQELVRKGVRGLMYVYIRLCLTCFYSNIRSADGSSAQ